MAEEKYVKVTLVRSLIGEPKRNKRTAEALGIRRINRSRIHRLTPQIEGMIKRIAHLVKVEEVNKPEK